MITKKSRLTVPVIVLALASAASAGLVFTVNGESVPDETTIQLGPSDEIELDLELGEGHDIVGYDLEYTLTNPAAEFITDPIEFPTWFDMPSTVIVDQPQYVQIAAANMAEPNPGPLVLMRNLRVHQLESTPVDLFIRVSGGDTVVDGELIPIGTLLHTLHIVPEPGTGALFSVAGLFLRWPRRRPKEKSK